MKKFKQSVAFLTILVFCFLTLPTNVFSEELSDHQTEKLVEEDNLQIEQLASINQTQIITGEDCSGYIDEKGNLWTWGSNNYGQLGTGNYESRKKPVLVMENVKQADFGRYFGAAVKTDGSVWTWGFNKGGCLGNGKEETSNPTPSMIIESGIKSISMGLLNGAAITEGGTLLIWGGNGSFQLGDGDRAMDAILKVWNTPRELMQGVSAVSIEGENVAVVKNDSSLWTWGNNVSGQLGYTLQNGELISPTPQVALNSVEDICLGDKYVTALKTDGSLWTWGENSRGELGDGTTVSRTEPEKILDDVKTIGNGCAVNNSGDLLTWGNNNVGQAGDGTTEMKSTPGVVLDNVRQVNRSSSHSGAIKEDGTIWTWGSNRDNALGNPYLYEYFQTTPQQIFVPAHAENEVTAFSTTGVLIIDEDTERPIPDVSIKLNNESIAEATDDQGYSVLNFGDSIEGEISFEKEGFETKIIPATEVEAGKINRILMKNADGIPDLILPEDIKVESDTLNGPSIEFFGEEFYLFSTDIKIDIPFGEVVKEIDREKKTVKCLLGIDPKEFKDFDWKKDYNDYVNFIKQYGANNGIANWNNSILRNKILKNNKSKIGFSLDAKVIGYIEYSYASGIMKPVEGGRIIEGSAKIGGSIPLSTPVFYFKWGLKGKVKSETEWVLVNKGDHISIDTYFDSELSCIPLAGVGAGIEKIAGAEVGIKGAVTGTAKIDTTMSKYDLEEIFGANISASVYFKIYAFFFETGDERTFMQWTLYPNKKRPDYNGSGGGGFRFNSLNNEKNQLKSIPRDYLNQPHAAVQKRSLAANVYEQKSVYPNGEPRLITLDDGRVMAFWIGDNGKKSDMNRTTLMYTINTNGVWSEAEAVCETGRADFSPTVYVKNGKVRLAWINATKEFSDNTTLEDMAKNVQISTAEFDGNTFSSPVYSNSGKMPLMLQITEENNNPVVYSVLNSGNDPFMMTGTETIYRQEMLNGVWEEPQVIQDNVKGLTGLACEDGRMLYSKDKDGDYTTNGDSAVYEVTANQSAVQISTDGADVAGLQYSGDRFYWLENGKLYDEKEKILTDITCTGDYRIINLNGQRAVLTTDKVDQDSYAEEIFIAYENENGFEPAMQLTDDKKGIRSFDAVFDESQKPVVAMNQINFQTEGEKEDPFGITDFIIQQEENRYDLVASQFMTYDSKNIAPGQDVKLTAEVKNESTEDFNDDVNVCLIDKDGKKISEFEYNLKLSTGETDYIDINYPLPEDLKCHEITASITPKNIVDNNLNNNIAEATIGYGDATITNSYYINAYGEGPTLYATVMNIGYETLKNVRAEVYQDGVMGEKLGSIELESMEPGQEKEVTFHIDESCIKHNNENDGKQLHVEILTDSLENRMDNNGADELVLAPKTRSIELSKKEALIASGQTIQLKAIKIPETSLSEVTWLNSDTQVADVDQNGLVKGLKPGSTVITVVSNDQVANCTITVKDGAIIPIESVTLEPKDVSLHVGETLMLKASILPENASNKTLKWESTDSNIVTVNNGNVMAVGVGDAVITVTTEDGNKKAFCFINVSEENGMLGDINQDGSINASDALLALRHAVKEIVLSGDQFIRADVTKDNVVNASDALQILRYSVKEITAFE